MNKIRLIVGLGNPGAKYANTRHNAGAWFIQELCDHYKVTLKVESKFNGLAGRIQTSDIDCFLLLPTTFMNKSGLAVKNLSNFYKIAPNEILIVHDELDFDCGLLRLKQGGGHGGHNGLRDIQAQLGSKDFYRLRIGIDRPRDQKQVTNYVLSPPSKMQQDEINQAIDSAISVIEIIIKGDANIAMNQLNQKK